MDQGFRALPEAWRAARSLDEAEGTDGLRRHQTTHMADSIWYTVYSNIVYVNIYIYTWYVVCNGM